MKDDLSSPPNAMTYSYKVCEDGPLTYYHYYFETVDKSVEMADSPPPFSSPRRLPAGLVGAGVLTAAFASGFAVVSIANQPSETPTLKQASSSLLKRKLPQNLAPTTQVKPEMPELMPDSLAKPGKPPIARKVSPPPNLKPIPPVPAKLLSQRSTFPSSSGERPFTYSLAVGAPETSTVAPKSVPSQPVAPPLRSEIEVAHQPVRPATALTSLSTVGDRTVPATSSPVTAASEGDAGSAVNASQRVPLNNLTTPLAAGIKEATDSVKPLPLAHSSLD